VGVQELLAIQPKTGREIFEPEILEPQTVKDATPPLPSCCVAKTCSATSADSTTQCVDETKASEKTRAETRFGITSFVYTTERMISRVKLAKELGKWQKARVASGDKLSLDGMDADATRPSTDKDQIDSPLAPILRSKGFVHLDANPENAFYWSHAGKSVSFSMLGPWPESTPEAEGGFGARRTELVFIGCGYDEEAIRKVLDSCHV